MTDTGRATTADIDMNELIGWVRNVLNDQESRALTLVAGPDDPHAAWRFHEACESLVDARHDQSREEWGCGSEGVVDDGEGQSTAVPYLRFHAEFDPRSVLARVHAERAVLDYFSSRSWDFWGFIARTPLSLIAYGHRFDAPGYRPEWAPEGVEVDA